MQTQAKVWFIPHISVSVFFRRVRRTSVVLILREKLG